MPAPSRILLVDDFPVVRRMIGRMLLELGFTEVDEAADGETAIRLLAKRRYALALIDADLPGFSGQALLEAVRGHPRQENLAVVFITADAGRARLESAARAGLDGFLVKPFSTEALAGRLARAQSRRAQAA